jgi:formate-dependent nitrite reductase membrane component NrfD
LVLFKLFAAGGAGILGFVGIAEFIDKKGRADTSALLTALLLLVAGGVAGVFQVAQPAKIMAFVRNLSSGSPISLELMAWGLCLIVAVVYLLVKRGGGSATRVLGVIAVAVALAVGFLTGYSHATMVGMPGWHTPTIPVSFLLSSMTFGGFCYVALAKRRTDEALIKVLVGLLIALSILVTIAFAAHGVVVPLGADAVAYWLLVPLVGGAVPVVASVMMRLKSTPVWVYLGVVAALTGALAFRVYLWITVDSGIHGLYVAPTTALGLF